MRPRRVIIASLLASLLLAAPSAAAAGPDRVLRGPSPIPAPSHLVAVDGQAALTHRLTTAATLPTTTVQKWRHTVSDAGVSYQYAMVGRNPTVAQTTQAVAVTTEVVPRGRQVRQRAHLESDARRLLRHDRSADPHAGLADLQVPHVQLRRHLGRLHAVRGCLPARQLLQVHDPCWDQPRLPRRPSTPTTLSAGHHHRPQRRRCGGHHLVRQRTARSGRDQLARQLSAGQGAPIARRPGCGCQDVPAVPPRQRRGVLGQPE